MCHLGGISVFGEMFKSPPSLPPPNHKQIIKNSVRKKAACETVRPVTSFKPRTATQKCFVRYEGQEDNFSSGRRGCGRSGGGFWSTGPSAEGNWEGLGYGNRRRRFLAGLPRFLQTRGCAKQKSLQRPPTIRFTDSVCMKDGILFNFFTVMRWRWLWRFEHLLKYWNLYVILFNFLTRL